MATNSAKYETHIQGARTGTGGCIAKMISFGDPTQDDSDKPKEISALYV